MRAVKFFVAILTLVGTLAPAAAQVCACVDWPVDRRMKEADQVFIGRAGQRRSEGNEEIQPFVVYQALKGEVPEKYELRHPQDLTCERSFQNQELALVFVVKGRAPICNGNVDIDKLIPSLDAYLKYEGQGSAAPELDVLALVLAGRFGHASKVQVYAPALAKKAVMSKGTKVSFVDKGADTLPSVGGTTRGALSFVALRQPDGMATFVLVQRAHGKLIVLSELKRDLTIK